MPPPSHPEPPLSPAQQHAQEWRQQRHEAEVNDGNAQMQEDLQPDRNGPTRFPSAPSHELFDMPTTVDPGYIISLIRKLVPVDGRQNDDIQGLTKLSEDRNANMNENGDIEMESDNLEQSPGSAECPKKSAREEAWEESGCILWDLAANKEHALFMVQNLVLDVLLANLMTSDSVRITEISLGIIGNLACHEVVMHHITSTNTLLETIVHQIFSEDTPCLCEVCRLLTLGLQGSQSIIWAKALQPDNILSRVLWIAENTLNPTLIEKSVGVLLAIMENEQDVAPILLPTLMKLGLPSLLVNLLAFEIETLTGDRMPERYPALDSILRAIEALSVMDNYSEEICSKKEVTHMAVELIKIPEKSEVSSSCVTAAVLIANILADSPDLALELSKDILLLQSLLDLFPFTSDDLEARNALWSILARFLVRIKELQMSPFDFSQYVWTLVSRLDLIEDVLLDGEFDRSSENNEVLKASEANLSSRTAATSCILNILYRWNVLKQEISVANDPVLSLDDRDVQKLLDCCLKHASLD